MEHPKAQTDERIILGIDPGTNVLGYGLLGIRGKEVRMIAMGVIDLRRVGDIYLKLGRIYERITGIIDSFLPDELAIEAPFLGKNIQTTLKIGRAQGVVITAAICRQIPICEYSPAEIKQAITGRGAAAKEQVAHIMQHTLKIPQEDMLPFLDATDALAAAYCHYLRTAPAGARKSVADLLPARRSTGKKKAASWTDFVNQNKDRVKGLND